MILYVAHLSAAEDVPAALPVRILCMCNILYSLIYQRSTYV